MADCSSVGMLEFWWICSLTSHSILLWLKHQIVNNTSLYCETSNWAHFFFYRLTPYLWIKWHTIFEHIFSSSLNHITTIGITLNLFTMFGTLTLFQERCLWRGKRLRMDWPSNVFPNELFCSLCQPIVDHDGGWRVYVRYEDLLACLKLKKRNN